mmetsp:Transcript_18632/g.33624  ORF Transcript_18632/g.33624 Transcript_18632/m.33624 type:complete len:246 (+) Transcript_18632:51-788(+)
MLRLLDAMPLRAVTLLVVQLQFISATSLLIGGPAHPRVDVGFGSFEANVTSEVVHALGAAKLRSSVEGGSWTQDMRKELTADVSASLKSGLRDAFAPVKTSIAKTWMALADPERQESYAGQMRSALDPIFANSMKSVADHLKLSIQRVEALPGMQRMSSHELVNASSGMVTDALLAEHCYGDAKGHATFVQSEPHPKKHLAHFCLPSLVTGFARRVNDTQGLLSMTMRFEAGAMSLAQQAKLTGK